MCLCVCVCMCMIITLMFRAFWRDCVHIVGSPPPYLVVSFPVSSTAASEKPSISSSFCLSNLLQLILHLLLSQGNAGNFVHSIVFSSLQSLPLLWSLTDMHYKHELKIGVCLSVPFFIHILCEHSVISRILECRRKHPWSNAYKNKLKLITWIVLMSTVSIM